MKHNLLIALAVALIVSLTFATAVFATSAEDPAAPSEEAPDDSSNEGSPSDEASSDESTSEEASSDESTSDESSSEESSSEESSSEESTSEESSSEETTDEDTTEPVIEPDGIMFAEGEIFLKPGKSHESTLVVSPEGAELPPLSFNSDNEGVATVDDSGVITAVDVGVAVITASSESGLTCQCTVRVTTSDISLSTNTSTGEKLATGFTLGMTGAEAVTEIALIFGVSESEVTLVGMKASDSVKTGAAVNVGGTEYTIIIYGDVNCDGLINTADVQTVADYLVSSVSFSAAQLYAADVTGDGRVTIENALIIQRHIYGKESISQ